MEVTFSYPPACRFVLLFKYSSARLFITRFSALLASKRTMRMIFLLFKTIVAKKTFSTAVVTNQSTAHFTLREYTTFLSANRTNSSPIIKFFQNHIPLNKRNPLLLSLYLLTNDHYPKYPNVLHIQISFPTGYNTP